MPSLKIIDGPGRGEAFALGDRATIGRWRHCDIQIKDVESSRKNSEVFLRDGRFHVRDLHSSNGTFVNGEPVDEQVLRHGDLIQIGAVTMEYVDEAADAEPDATSATESPAAKLEPEPLAVAENVPAPQPTPVPDEEIPGTPLAAPVQEPGATGQEPSPEEPTPTPKPFPQIPGYEISSRIRRDPISTTYAAVETAMDRPAVLVVLAEEYSADPDAVLARIKSAARLEHPVLAAVHAAGVCEGRVYCAREPATRQTTWELCGKLPAAEVARIGAEAADALAEAHAASIIHGSLRPDLLVRTASARVKLLGLGLPFPKVGELSTQPDLQRQPNRIAYMPPGQLAGGRPRETSDIYALGAVLYHMLCGRTPFVAISEAELAPRIAAGNFEHVLDLKPETPKGLAAAIERMLAPSPDDRPRAMGEVARELRAAYESIESPDAARPAAAIPLRRAATEPRGLSAGTIVIIILTLLLMLLAFLYGQEFGRWFIQQGGKSSRVTGAAHPVVAAWRPGRSAIHLGSAGLAEHLDPL